MARHRSHSVAFKRQVAQEFVSGETLHGLAKRHDLSRNLIRLWVQKYEAGAFDDLFYGERFVPRLQAKSTARRGRALKDSDWRDERCHVAARGNEIERFHERAPTVLSAPRHDALRSRHHDCGATASGKPHLRRVP